MAINPKDVHALTNKGVSLSKLGNYTGAIEYFDRALAINPKHENALLDKGSALNSLGNSTGAIEYYDMTLDIDPKDEDALYDKGLALDNLDHIFDPVITAQLLTCMFRSKHRIETAKSLV